MTYLIAGLVVFFAAHAVPMIPALSRGAAGALGARGRKGLVALASAIGLGLIVWGKAQAPFEPLFEPPAWGRMAAHAVMPLAFILLAAAYAPANRIRAGLRHPMLLAVLLWSGGHLAANGDVASALLFGSFGVFAALDLIFAAARKEARPRVGSWASDAGVVVIGLVVYVAVLHAHPMLFGVRALT